MSYRLILVQLSSHISLLNKKPPAPRRGRRFTSTVPLSLCLTSTNGTQATLIGTGSSSNTLGSDNAPLCGNTYLPWPTFSAAAPESIPLLR